MKSKFIRLVVKNNIFLNRGAGRSATFSSNPDIEFDYNNYYSNGPVLLSFNGTLYSDLASYRAASLMDSNSLAVNPQYVSATDLHVKNAQLYKAGTPIPGINLDIDGEPRDTMAPCIGADEFQPLPDDAMLAAFLSPYVPFLPDSIPITVVVFNNGSNTIDSVTIQWTVNGVLQPPFQTNVSLAAQTYSDTLTIGFVEFSPALGFNIVVWTENPNGNPDANTANDTITRNDLYAALSGIYTVGGPAPDFSNLANAVAALQLGGVVGEVIFDIRNGTYTAQYALESIIGTSAGNTVTFRSESGMASQVVLAFNSNATATNFIFKLTNAPFIQFENLTFNPQGASFSRAIELSGDVTGVKFKGCIFTTGSTFTSSFNRSFFNGSSLIGDSLIVSNCTFLEGAYGVYLSGTGTVNTLRNVVIRNNLFSGTYYNPVYVGFIARPHVEENTINTTKASSGYAIRVASPRESFRVLRNYVLAPSYSYGISTSSATLDSTNRGIVANNMVKLGASTAYGIVSENMTNVDYVYNSIWNTSTGTFSPCFYHWGGNVKLENNILVHTGNGYGVYLSSGPLESDYNNIFVSAPKTGYFSGDRATLSDWQSASGLDSNSLAVDPLFVSATDLHTREISLNGAARPHPVVVNDFDGDLRHPVTPDIGADEFEIPAANDAGITAINAPVSPFNAGPNDVKAVIRNFGSTPLQSATINWQVNNTLQIPFSWTGNLAVGQVDTVTIGSFTFVQQELYSITCWTSQPNGVTDSVAYNDTTIVTNIRAALAGVFTIGGVTPDFATFNEAVSAMQTSGVGGAVTFNVRQGFYSERVIIPAFPGMGASNPVVFQSEDNDSLAVSLYFSPSGTTNNNTLLLNGASHITFRKMTIRSGSGYYSRVIELAGGSSDIRFQNCYIHNSYTGYSGTNSVLVYASSATNNPNLEILNNNLRYGTNGVLLSGLSTAQLNPGTRIEGNIFEYQRYTYIGVYYQDNPIIRGNEIVTGFGSSYSQYGVDVQFCNNGFEVSGNKIHGTFSGSGISLNQNTCTIGNPGSVFNNFITGSAGAFYGIHVSSCQHNHIYFNNLNLFSNVSSSRAGLFQGNNNIRVQNNNWVNTGAGYALEWSNSAQFSACSHNNIYTTGSLFCRLGANDHGNLTAWQTATGLNSSSLSIDPLYISSTDLHVQSALLDSAGTPVPGITTDIDGDLRNSLTPDIGADEFNNFENDLALLQIISPASSCNNGAFEAVTLRIRNYGSQPQTGFDLSYQFGNNAVVTENVGSLVIQPGASVDYTFSSTVDLSFLGTYIFSAWTGLTTDDFSMNDSLLNVQVTSHPPFSISKSSNQAICQGNNTYLFASGGSTYLWSTGFTGSGFFASPVTTTLYYVTVTSSVGCQVADSILVTVNPLPATPQVTPTGNQTVCFGDSILLTSNIASNITWNNGKTNPSIHVKAVGNYFVTHKDPFTNCTASSNTVNVSFRPEIYLTSSAPGDTICLGQSVTLTVMNGSSYSWSTGQNTSFINVTPAAITTYSVTVTGTGGCVRVLQKTLYPLTLPAPGAASNLLPTDGTGGLNPPVLLSWSPGSNATAYDIYIWPLGQSQPGTPTIANYGQISISYNTNLAFGQTYNWRVVATNACTGTPSAIQTFSIRELPDLIVENVQAPASAFSGQNVSFTWEIKNNGSGPTLGNVVWYDRYFLSPDQTLDLGVDIFLGSRPNISALQPGQSYTNTASFNLPQGISGFYYVIVETDAYNNVVLESNEGNNVGFNIIPIAVYLTPPPDLVVSSIVTPFTAFSGNSINVTWEVTNQGQGSTVTGSWSDRIYISADSVFSLSNSLVRATVAHSGSLASGNSYTQSQMITLPNGVFGTYYVYVTTDIFNSVFEHAFEANNNSRSGPINVILTPPADLVVTQVGGPASVSSRESLNISWEVMNQGGSPVQSATWIDRIQLSADSTGLTNPISLGTRTISNLNNSSNPDNPFNPGDSYNRSVNFNTPSNLSGQYYVYVTTNHTGTVYEHIYTANNTLRAPNPIEILNPDLVVTTVSAPDSFRSGNQVVLTWKVANAGPGNLVGASRTDRLMISPSSVYNPPQMTFLSNSSYNLNILAGDTITRTATVTIPNGLFGTLYFYVYTDYSDNILEVNEFNNVGRSDNKTGLLSPWPDLQVVSVGLPDTLVAGATVTLSATIQNLGDTVTPLVTWKDGFYLSTSPTWSSNSILLRSLSRTQFLSPDSSYTISTTLNLSGSLAPGTYYIHVFTDYENNVFEHTDENNNIFVSQPLVALGYPPVDIAVTQVSGPASGSSGQSVSASWTIENVGNSRTLANNWKDAVYLSADTIFDPGTDILVLEWNRNGALDPGQSYQQNRTFNLPNGVSGSYYMLAVADRQNANNDSDYSNNAKVMVDTTGGGGGGASPINIQLTPSPDLLISAFSAPLTGTSGQPIELIWTVSNIGPGPTLAGSWTDRFFLSTDFSISQNDVILGSRVRSGNLNPGQSYSDTITVNLPASSNGNYIIIARTDNSNVVYEHNAEHNNTETAFISVSQPPPCDLVVTNVFFPAGWDTVTAGKSARVGFVVQNIGQNPANGIMRSAVYFSEDTVWDVGDPLFGINYRTAVNPLALPPGAVDTMYVFTRLPALSLGNYFAIVAVDLLNNIVESNDTNNVTASVSTVFVSMPELPTYTLVADTLEYQRELYYRIEVPDSLVGETLLISMESANQNGQNELYVRFGQAPTRAVYDFSHSEPFAANQEVVIPALQRGTYYLMAYGKRGSSFNPQTQAIELYARKLNFEIRDIVSNVVGNRGSVTVRIDGSKFEPGMMAVLEKDSTVRMGLVDYINPTRVYVTWFLSGPIAPGDTLSGETFSTFPFPIGYYDVSLIKPNQQTVTRDSGLHVIETTGEIFYYNIHHPSATTPGRIISMSIQVANVGNVDIPSPIRNLISKGGAPIAFTVEDLNEGEENLYMEFLELNGPEATLRPGGASTIVVYARALGGTLSFILFDPNEE